MKQTTVTVPEERAQELRNLATVYASQKEVIALIIERNKNAEDTTVLESPVFKAYQNQLGKINSAYEAAKFQLQADFIPSDYNFEKVEWTLNYDTCEMEIKELD